MIKILSSGVVNSLKKATIDHLAVCLRWHIGDAGMLEEAHLLQGNTVK